MAENTTTLINGKACETLSVSDRGFQYGDGLFETLAVFDGEIKHWPLHWTRLCEGCKRLFLPQPNEMQILSEIDTLSAGIGKEIVKVILSRGIGKRGYAFQEITPTRVVSLHSWPELLEENAITGITLFVCKTTVARQLALAGIKHLNRLENVLARHEWQEARYAEGIMLDENGNVIEGTMSNLFIIKNNVLQTPDLSHSGVAGITRQRIMSAAKEKGITLEVTNISLSQLKNADEVFVCNTLIGIWPVKEVENKTFLTGDESNPVTQYLQEAIA